MVREKKSFRQISRAKTSPFKDYWGKYNYYVLYFGVGLLVLGYILMSKGPWDNVLSLSISPIIVLLAYLAVIPISIVFKFPKKFHRETDVSSKN